jgi:YfiH family protein
MPLLRSPLIPPPFVHGFTTREHDHETFAPGAGLTLYRVKQVHGADVLHVPAGADPAAVRVVQADVLLTTTAGVAVAVRTADCVPVLLCAPGRGAAAAIHAGWRGTVARAVVAAVRALGELGVPAAELRAAIGPAICGGCYEVGAEVAQAVAAIDPAAVHPGPRGTPHADLRRANQTLLLAAGLAAAHVDLASLAACTRCDPQGRFHSYRRDGDLRGEQLAFIGVPA